MNGISEVAERELTYEELAERYRVMCEDKRFENLQGKVELDTWGRMQSTWMDCSASEVAVQRPMKSQNEFSVR